MDITWSRDRNWINQFVVFDRARGRVVVVVVRELLFLVMSVICVWIRGHSSEVMTTLYHFHSDFCLLLHSYQSGLVVLFLRCQHKTYRYSV